MKRLMNAECLWRCAMVCALGWIAWELHGIREDMMQPVDDEAAVTADVDTDGSPHCLDAVQHRIAGSGRKVEAIPLAMTTPR